MIEPSDETGTPIQQWCDHVAAICVDALIYAKLVEKSECDRAIQIVSEEICVRLCARDYPPKLVAKD
jgi:hypothetical protein